MKLISCHIENFGKLSDLTLHFQEGVHSFCHENGWGKSTFAAFLRVMFYGFEGERKRVGRNERNYYRPWQGGVYGGQIVFESGKKQYQMSRVFGKKASEDTFELRDALTNMPCSDFSAAIGRELFEIDSEAFLRTVFIGQNDCATNTTGDINAKIGNLTEQTDDLSGYDASMARIKDLMNQMAPDRKRGSIRKMEDEETRLLAEQRREAALGDAIRELQKKLETEQKTLSRLKSEQHDILKDQKYASAMKEAQAKKERYEEICDRYQKAKEVLAEAKQPFPKEPPGEEKLTWALGQCMELAKAYASLESFRLPPKEEAALSSLSRKFQEEIPLQEDCEKMRKKNHLLMSLRRESPKKELSSDERKAMGQYEEQFGAEEYTAEMLSSLQEEWAERLAKQKVLEEKRTEAERLRGQEANGRRGRLQNDVLLQAAGMLAALAGLALSMRMLVPGILLVVCGAAIALVGFLRGSQRKKQQSRAKEAQDALAGEIRRQEEAIGRIDEKIGRYLGGLGGVPEENMVAARLQQLSLEFLRYEDLKKKAAFAEEGGENDACQTLSGEIKDYLLRFGMDVSELRYADAIHCLESERREYEHLSEMTRRLKECEQYAAKTKLSLHQMLLDFGIEPRDDLQGQISELIEELRGYLFAKKTLEEEEKAKKEFEEKHDIERLLKDMSRGGIADLRELNESYEKNSNDMERIKSHIDQYETQLEDLLQQSDEIREAGEKLRALQIEIGSERKKYELLGRTRQFLAEAKESLTARYTGPLVKSFVRYYECVAADDALRYHMDADARVTFEEQGMQRELLSHSVGYQDLVNICLRLALADAMYPGEKPMLILDDPFVNLDGAKMEGAKRLLDLVSREYQVLYFTCNESRRAV